MLEDVEQAVTPDFTNLKAQSSKIKDALHEPEEITWRNDVSEGDEKKENEQSTVVNANSNNRDYKDALKLHKNIKLVSEK